MTRRNADQTVIDWSHVCAVDPETAFEQWILANPKAYRTLANKAMYLKSKHGRVGAKYLGEYARWELALDHRDMQFKWNNNFTPYLARRLERDFPLLKGAFEKRRARADI
jgi:hypothetical protein